MPRSLSRRRLLQWTGAAAAAPALPAPLAAPLIAWAEGAAGLRFGPARPFSFAALTARAEAMAARPTGRPTGPRRSW